MVSPGGNGGEQAYLRLQIAPQCEAAVAMAYAQEALVVPVLRMTLLPNTHPAMMGLLNHRNRVFWVVDLPYLLGFPMLPTSLPEYAIALLRIEDHPLALAVPQIKGVMRAGLTSLQSPLEFDLPQLIPYLQGCLRQENNTLLVLDAPAIARGVEQH